MQHRLTYAVLLAASVLGCGGREPVREAYVPEAPTHEEQELIDAYSKFSGAIRDAISRGGDYEQVAIVDRNTVFPDDDQRYTRVLVLHREVLDLDDYGFSVPGRESSENDEDQISGFYNDVMFWAADDGKLIVDESRQPPGTYLVAEWCVPNNAGERVSLHYGGIPCLELDLTRNGSNRSD